MDSTMLYQDYATLYKYEHGYTNQPSFISFLPIFAVFGVNMYAFYQNFKSDIHTYLKCAVCKLRGLEHFDRNNKPIFRNFTDYEYGTRIESFWSENIKQGIFKDNQLNGLGSSFTKSNETSEYSKGIFKNNKLHGKGTLIFIDHYNNVVTHYTGLFCKHKLHTEGSISNKFFTVTGTFSHGHLRSGKIIIHKYDVKMMSVKYNGIKMIQGNFGKNSLLLFQGSELPWITLNGHGKITYENNIESGTFKDSNLQGYGVRINNISNTKYIGQYVNDELHGTGKIITSDFTVKADFNNGVIESKFMITDGDGECECNMITQAYKYTFKNGDEFTGLLPSNFEFNLRNVPYLLCPDIGEITNPVYTMNDGFESMGNVEFMTWLYATDNDLYNILFDSNLCEFITGELYCSFTKPEDFNLPTVNNNVLDKLLSYKNKVEKNEDGIVYITKVVD